jgi:ABC-type branched-subunit amino acid transport system ATPase component
MLELRHVSKHFSGIPAVDDVSFCARPGEVTAYLGPNGSGKTTTLKMINGLIEMTFGHILFEGKPIQDDLISYKRRIVLAVSFAPIEMVALGSPFRYACLCVGLIAVALGLCALNRHRAKSAVLYFEELPDQLITTLGLSSPSAMAEPGQGPITL